MKAEYVVDVDQFTDSMIRFIERNGGDVSRNNDGKVSGVRIGRRPVHRHAGSRSARVFFDETTAQQCSDFILQFAGSVTNLRRTYLK